MPAFGRGAMPPVRRPAKGGIAALFLGAAPRPRSRRDASEPTHLLDAVAAGMAGAVRSALSRIAGPEPPRFHRSSFPLSGHLPWLILTPAVSPIPPSPPRATSRP